MFSRNRRTSALLLIALAFFLLSSGFPVKHDPYQPDRRVDITHYTFRLEVTDNDDVVEGHATVHVQFREGGIDAVVLDLVSPETDGSGMSVSRVLGDEQALDYEHEDNRLTILLPRPAATADRLTLDVFYSGTPSDGLIISQNKYGERTFFGDNWPNRARQWLPSVDHPAEKSSVEFVVTAPNHYQVVGSGSLIEKTDLEGDRRRTHYGTKVPLATKVMVVGIARFAIERVEIVNGVPVESWVYPQDREAGFSDYRRAAYILRYFHDKIGPYPYEKLANVQSKTRYGGMENAGNIFYSENSVTGTGSSEGLLAHEIAHQWFGDSVSEGDWHHIWLSEGFATYFTQLYMEHTYGRDRMVAGLQSQREAIIRYHERNPDSPVVDTTITDLNRLLSTNSYQKGGWVLHMLRGLIGDDMFSEGIRLYYERFRDANALTSDLRKCMEDASGKDLGWFFDQWIHTPGQPTLASTWSYDDDRGVATVRVTQTQGGSTFRTPIEVGFVFDDASSSVLSATLDEKTELLTFELAKAPSSVVLDPNTWLLARIEASTTR